MFNFLENEEVQDRFAILNMDLLHGKHIEQGDFYQYRLLDKYQNEFTKFYESLYGLALIREGSAGEIYYYLSFSEDGRGKLSNPSLFRELTSLETVVGIVLLKMFKARYFDHIKEITWSDIKIEILESGDRQLYGKLLFGDARESYSQKEWGRLNKRVCNSLQEFKNFGWVDKLKIVKDASGLRDIRFVLRASIQRFERLYENEITNFDQFVENYKTDKPS